MINWIGIATFLVVIGVTIKIIHHYASKHTDFYVFIFVFLGYFLAFGILGLIPYDLYLTTASDVSNASIDSSQLLVLWTVVYWSAFVLCW
jgi:LMBR1-like membrane protein